MEYLLKHEILDSDFMREPVQLLMQDSPAYPVRLRVDGREHYFRIGAGHSRARRRPAARYTPITANVVARPQK